MKISICENGNLGVFRTLEIKSSQELKQVILNDQYSLGIYRDEKRKKDNFIQTDLLGLDYDDGVTLEEAKELFKEHKHIIAPTKSHQKEKNGKVCDRFRVILFLTIPIRDNATFEATWFSLYEKYPKIDKACKDSSRYFDPSIEIYSCKFGKGITIDPVTPKPKSDSDDLDNYVGNLEREHGTGDVPRGKLANSTARFLIEGAPSGQKHVTLYKAARDAYQNGFAKDWFLAQVHKLSQLTGEEAYVDTGALKTIEDAYRKEPKHEPRIEHKAFHLVKIGDLYKDKTEVDWLVDGLLTKGGLSLMSGDPKAGKSTLVRQLIRDILRGAKFLGRDCKQGMVHYYGIEEQKQVINASFRRLGVTAEDELFVHVGDPLTENTFKDFRDILLETKPALAVIDTLFDFLEVESENNYREVKVALRKLRQVARDSGTHIVCVHHNSKGQKDDRRRGNRAILGSAAIAGGMDAIAIIEIEGDTRYITTTGREIKRWNRREIVFHENDKTYTLGPEHEEF